MLLSFPSTEETIKQISEIREKLETGCQRHNPLKRPLLNSRQSQKNITKLIDDEGNVHTSKDQILNHIAEFYTKLYTEEPTDAQAQQKLLNSIHRRLPTDVSETLEGS